MEFRTLVPGGGTDGGVPFLAEQSNHTNSEIVYVDFSKSSTSIIQFKIKLRGWLKVVWVIDWIESIPRLGLGMFDFAVSTGVLHHLKSPRKGLDIVHDAQMEYGGAEFMVYATTGRIAVYIIQRLIRVINQNEQELRNEIKNAKTILNILPSSNWFNNHELSDHKTMGDVGIYDLLLHKRDVAFSKFDLYSCLENSGYIVVDFACPSDATSLNLNNVFHDGPLLEKITRMDTPAPYAIGEIIYGATTKQQIYVSKQHNSIASLSLTEDVIYAYGSPTGFRHVMSDKSNYYKLRNKTFVFAKFLQHQVAEEGRDFKLFTTKDKPYTGKFIWPLTEFNEFVIGSLTRKPIRPKTLLSLITDFKDLTKSNLTLEEGISMFKDLFAYIKDFKIFFFKHKSIPTFPITCCGNLYSVFGSYRIPNSKTITQTDSIQY